MEHTLIRHERLTVREKIGHEGPRHDPYGYTELHVKTEDVDVVLHEGLMLYMILGGVKTMFKEDEYKEQFEKVLVDVTGFTEKQLRRFHDRASSRCPEGGYHDTESVDGYPGESLCICCKCGNVVGSYFSIDAVM